MQVSIIVASAHRSVIGRNGNLPWHLRADLRRFRRLTTGHVIVMGRRTFDSIGKGLPGRFSLVVTRSAARVRPLENVRAVESLEQAINEAPLCGLDQQKLFVIGGAEIYRLALPIATELHVTHVDADVDGDVYFPEVDWSEWQSVSHESLPADAENDFPTRYELWRRIEG